MSQRRCGLGVTALPDGKVYAAGGYGGDMVYLRSAEVRLSLYLSGKVAVVEEIDH